MIDKHINVSLERSEVKAVTYPAGPRGYGIANLIQTDNTLTVFFEDGTQQALKLPNWWFGTRTEYNALTKEEKESYSLHFIEEGS